MEQTTALHEGRVRPAGIKSARPPASPTRQQTHNSTREAKAVSTTGAGRWPAAGRPQKKKRGCPAWQGPAQHRAMQQHTPRAGHSSHQGHNVRPAGPRSAPRPAHMPACLCAQAASAQPWQTAGPRLAFLGKHAYLLVHGTPALPGLPMYASIEICRRGVMLWPITTIECMCACHRTASSNARVSRRMRPNCV